MPLPTATAIHDFMKHRIVASRDMDQLQQKKDSKAKDVLLITSGFNEDEASQLLKDIKEQHPTIKPETVGNTPIDAVPIEILHATKWILGYNNFPKPEQPEARIFTTVFGGSESFI